SRRAAVGAALTSTSAASIGISLLQLAAGSAVLPRFVVFSSALVLLPFLVLCATLAQDGRARAVHRDRIVVVAGVDEGINVVDDLSENPERPAELVALLAPESARSTDPRSQPLVEAVRAAAATTLVLDRSAQADDSIVAQAAVLHESGTRVRTLSLFYEEWLGKLPVSELERVSLMFDIGELHRARYGRMKRMLDAGLALAGLMVLVAVMPFVLVGNLVGNRGSLFFRQDRVGKGGRVFEIVKFRTMAPGAPGPAEWTGARDPRITPFGAWLRRSHLDELPQVLNVLRGQLSVVGPRPEQPHYVEQLEGKIPFYRLRHLVRPGLTGWAQVKYPYGADETDAIEKLQYEFYYLRHQRLSLDFRVIGRTLRTVIGRTGR
ncbi:MAG: sugar transferase, partial [Acidimicrobiales bacterium]